MHRLFFALWPDDVTRRALTALQSQLADCGGRASPPDNLHMTLAFLGQQSGDAIPVLDAILQALQTFDCMITLDRFGEFSRQRLVWIGPQQPPDALLDMQRTLIQKILAAGIQMTDRHAEFVPHVTLMRDATLSPHTPSTLQPAIKWRASRIALAESISGENGVQYRLLSAR